MAGYIGSKSSVTQVDGYSEAEADAEFVNDPNGAITVDGSNVGIGGTVTVGTVADGQSIIQMLANPTDGANTIHFGDGTGLDAYDGYIQYPHDLRVLQFGTAGTERMRIDSSGNVGIGTSSSYPLTVQSGTAGSNHALALRNSSNNFSRLGFLQTDSATAAYTSIDGDGRASGYLKFNTNDTERMRIDSSGRLLVNTPSVLGSGKVSIKYTSTTETGITIQSTIESYNTAVQFLNTAGTQVGTINTGTSSTAYNTSSDYRLKENLVDLTGASARVNQLNPLRFNWITDDTNTAIDGFLAHEVATVVPEAITGTKDAMMDEEYEVTPAVLDDDGNVTTEAVMGTRSVPDYQGIDQSKLVPLLTAALQEALTEIASLKTRVEALEA